MKIQACQFKLKEKDDYQDGLAFVKNGFGEHDVNFIVSMNGKVPKQVWTYRLLEGPLKHIDFDYV